MNDYLELLNFSPKITALELPGHLQNVPPQNMPLL